MIFKSTWLVILMLVTISCAKVPTPASQQAILSIRFGSGGGFTGKTTSYRLEKSGRLFRTDQGADSLIANFATDRVEKIFHMAQKAARLKISDPHNFYYFIEFQLSDSVNYIVWNKGTVDKKDLEELYQNLNDLIPR